MEMMATRGGELRVARSNMSAICSVVHAVKDML